MTNRRTLDRLRRRIATFEPIPLDTLPEPETVPLPIQPNLPPPGGWPDDSGWTAAAETHFANAGEEPQE